ncbi:MAG: glycosyltransferase family 39 protein [Phycisphaerales bacterium]
MRPPLCHRRIPIHLWRWWLALTPALVVLLITLAGIDQGDFRTDSHVYAAVTLKMVESGDWLHPMLGDAPYHRKPPMAFWMVAPFIKAFGAHLWSVRLAMGIYAGLTASAVFLMLKEVVRLRVAMAAALVFALTHEVFRYTHAYSLDLPLALLVVLTAWGVVHAAGVRRGKPRSPWWVVLAGVPMGASLMVKPGAALLLVPVLAVWLVSVRRWRLTPWLGALLVFSVLIALPWHLLMIRDYPAGSPMPFLDTYFGAETIQRFQGGDIVVRSPVWYYPQQFGETYWPWLIGLVGALVWMAWRRRPVTGSWAGDGLGLAWGGIWLGVLSLLAGKSMRYVVPAYPGLSLLVAGFIVRVLPRGKRRLGRLIPFTIAPVLALLVALVIVSGVRLHPPPPEYRAELFAYLDQYGGDSTAGWPPLWIAPDQHRTAAHIYLERGVYPRLARSPNSPLGGEPSVGDLMLYRMHDPAIPLEQRGWYAPRPGDAVLAHFGLWTVTRIDSPWTGRYTTRDD